MNELRVSDHRLAYHRSLTPVTMGFIKRFATTFMSVQRFFEVID